MNYACFMNINRKPEAANQSFLLFFTVFLAKFNDWIERIRNSGWDNKSDIGVKVVLLWLMFIQVVMVTNIIREGRLG